MHTRHAAISNPGCRKQRGAALMVMLVIMVMGAAALMVSSLSSSVLQTARNETTAAALAQAKDALIGRAVADSNHPGSLPCPDLLTNIPGINIPNDGAADLLSGNHCPSYVGRLPWKTLGLPDLRDGDGERLWYALSPSVRDDNSALPINSDTLGQFNITGNGTMSNVVAIVFSPGAVLSSLNQARDSANQNNAINYLESNNATNAATIATDITNGTYTNASSYTFTTNTLSATFNDQLIPITHDQLFQPVEMRITREVRSCMNTYAASSAGKYPWAAPVTDTTFTTTTNTFFGRVPVTPTDSGGASSPTITALLAQQSLLTNVQTALAAYVANPNATNTNNLRTAAQNLIDSTSNPLTSSVNGTVDTAGDRARDLANGTGVTLSTVNTAITNASSALNTALTNAGYTPPADPSMQSAWPASCIVASAYWPSWQNQVFYQVANGYQPGSSASCTGTNCITINGTGNTAAGNGTYRAAVLVARRPILGQVRNTANSATYLENLNQHQATLTTTFETYAPSDPNYSTVNDLVLCLDGTNNCK